MEELLEKLDSYRKEIDGTEPDGAEAAEAYRIRFLGTKGIVKNLFHEMKNVPAEKKKEFGQILNEFKQLAESKYDELKTVTHPARAGSPINQKDWSLPGDPIHIGTRHPISLVRNRIIQIFGRLGFSVAEGPEIEDDWHNFTALTCRKIILQEICRILFMFLKTLTGCCVHIPAVCRHVKWKNKNHP